MIREVFSRFLLNHPQCFAHNFVTHFVSDSLSIWKGCFYGLFPDFFELVDNLKKPPTKPEESGKVSHVKSE